MTHSGPKLVFFYSPGACSLAPHIVFEEANLSYEGNCVLLSEGQHLTEHYRAINPQLRVPALLIDGALLTEVPAILTYLASLNPQANLIPPSGSYDYGQCLEMLAYLSSSLHIAYAQFWRPERFVPADFDSIQEFSEQGRIGIERVSSVIEAKLNSEWVIGNQYTIADSYLLPFYRWGVRIGIDMESNFPRWTAWKARIIQRQAVRRAIELEGIGFEWKPD